MTNETLLPCPFCGGEASDKGWTRYGRPLDDAHWADGSAITEAFYVNCIGCSASNRSTLCGGFQTKEQAVEHWNTRAAQSQPAATVQEVGQDVTKDVLASLVAALSILNRAHAEHKEPRKVVSSDAMFAQMLKDYEASVVRARAALTAEPAAKAGDARSISVAEEWAVYMDVAVSKAPEPLRQLGEYLAGLLDEDQWKTAERYLNGALLATPSGRAQGEVAGYLVDGEWTDAEAFKRIKYPEAHRVVTLYAAPPAQDQTKGDEA